MKKISLIILLAVILIIVGALWHFYYKESKALAGIHTFQDCADNGYPVLESFPRQCKTPDGRSFTENVGQQPADISDLIQVTNPKPNEVITSPLTVEGVARGPWFFEASFPVRLLDSTGKEIAVVPAQAEGEWMTENFVSFKAELKFENAVGHGMLVFQKDNPSGLPEFDRELKIPIIFGAPSLSETPPPCKPTGCSGQVCSEKEVVTTCEFRPEYACYQSAKCERQLNGQCGWTETAQLRACLGQ